MPGEDRVDGQTTPQSYWQAFSLVTFTMNRFMLDQVLRATRYFDNEAEAMVLFGTVVHLSVGHLVPPNSGPASVMGGQWPRAGWTAAVAP
jgi:hypothetical protein